MNEPEFHLFCIWKKGIPFSDNILSEIQKNLTVLSVKDISWSGQSSVKSLFRFYTNPEWIIFWKYLQCGGYPVRMIIVRDDAPEYQLRHTNSGDQTVNVKMFDAKMRLRKMLKNGHWIHATNSPVEFAFNYAMLTGKPANTCELKLQAPWDNTTITKEVTIPTGQRSWKDLRAIFDILLPMGQFIVLRNFENLPESCQLGPHSDIDILTTVPGEMIRLLDLKRASRLPFRAAWRAEVADSWVNIDIRTPGDGYYPVKMMELLLKNSVLHNGIPVPSPEHYFYALIYHAAIHKYKMSEEYRQRLLAMAEKMDLKPTPETDPRLFLAGLLSDWMQKHGFSFTEPRDLTVNFNTAYLPKQQSISFRRRIKNLLFRLLGKKSTL